MRTRDSYLAGVPCWVDIVQPDFDATTAFYGALFGWSFEIRTPPEAPVPYAYARLDGYVVAGAGGAAPGGSAPQGWTQYVAVASVDDTTRAAVAAGATVVEGPTDIPRAGRVALLTDPTGAPVGLWEPRGNPGAEVVNEAGSWNFSELRTSDPERAVAFYETVFGWESDHLDFGAGETWLWRRPGYGEFLAAREPGLLERLADVGAPAGFADAVAWLSPAESGTAARWHLTFAVADADAALARAVELGAGVVTPAFDTAYTRQGEVRDPQGETFTLGEFRPPAPT